MRHKIKKTKETGLTSLLQIGVSTEAVKLITAAILSILKLDRSDPVLIVALETFQKATRVENTTVHNCHFISNPKE